MRCATPKVTRGLAVRSRVVRARLQPSGSADPRQIAVVNRVLQYFEQMVSVRLQADVQAKAAARRPVPLLTGQPSRRAAKATAVEPETQIATATKTITAVARTKVIMSGACCGQFGSQIELYAGEGALHHSIGVVYASCPLHSNQRQMIELSQAEMIEAVKNASGEDDTRPPSAQRKKKSRKAK